MSTLVLNNVSYTYEGTKKPVLKNLNYEFDEGQIYAITGKSGAGKTTLLSILSSLAAPTEGSICLDGQNVAVIDKYRYRSTKIGVVFQSFNLLPHLTALENVVLSLQISGIKIPNKKHHASVLLEKVGITKEESERRVLKLSGGQQQRVAIARALSYNPSFIMADEPTGNLDEETQDEIMSIFRSLADEGKCIIIVTHAPRVAAFADVSFKLDKKSS